MKRCIAAGLLWAFLMLQLVGCAPKYDAGNFIGKTSAEIISEFGPFDCTTMPVSEEGLYRNCKGGYTIKKPQIGFFGTSAEVLFFITFNENGIAIECEEGHRPGG